MSSSEKLILASASPRRLDLLAQIGVTPTQVIPADIDETPLKGELPKNYVIRVAYEKMQAIAKNNSQSYILSADTTVACGRRILPKAQDEQTARECLKILSGRRHNVFTAVAFHRPAKAPITKYVSSMVQFKHLTQADINWYISTSEWDGKAGGYAIQGAAQALIKQMHGSHSAVVGLPLQTVRNLLMSEGLT